MVRSVHRPFLVLLSVASLGCHGSIATVQGVARDGRVVTPREGETVTVRRGGETLQGDRGTPLARGNTVESGQDTRTVIAFGTDYEIILDPDSELEVLNPSVFLRRGRMWVRKVVERARESFVARTRVVRATAAGTEFLLSADEEPVVAVSVMEGVVVVASESDGWAPVTYEATEGGVFRPGQPPTRSTPLTEAEVREIQTRYRTIRDLLPQELARPPGGSFWRSPAGIGVAAGAAVGIGALIYALAGGGDGDVTGTVTIPIP